GGWRLVRVVLLLLLLVSPRLSCLLDGHPPPSLAFTRLPSRPTIFPYTTLFRSIFQRATSGDSVALFYDHRHGLTAVIVEQGYAVDRKSTRLNSSHDQISYAVSCLKKKNLTPATYVWWFKHRPDAAGIASALAAG